MGKAELEDLVRQAEQELDQPGIWGTPFTGRIDVETLPARNAPDGSAGILPATD